MEKVFLWLRFFATLLDIVFIFCPLAFLNLLLSWLFYLISPTFIFQGGPYLSLTMLFIGMGLFLFRDIPSLQWGKRLLGLKLEVSSHHNPYQVSMLRNLPLILPPVNLLELYLFFSQKKRLGDRLAGTRIMEL